MKEEQQYVLIIIESLRENDKKTGTILESELLKLKKFQQPDLKTRVFSINSKNELISLFESIISVQQKIEFIPHLHFEIHGFENGLELTNGDRINWSELMDYFSQINFWTKNYLVIYLAVCYGSSILKNISPLGRAPFKALITPGQEITEPQILSGFTSFYDEYFTSFDLKESVNKMNEELGERIFGLVLAEYCFDRITRFEPDSAFGNNLMSSLKNRFIYENSWLKDKPDSEINKLITKSWKNYSDYLKTKRDYFLMNDIK
jgi:hypothetical protein